PVPSSCYRLSLSRGRWKIGRFAQVQAPKGRSSIARGVSPGSGYGNPGIRRSRTPSLPTLLPRGERGARQRPAQAAPPSEFPRSERSEGEKEAKGVHGGDRTPA